jgi:hypothetical protein
MEKPVFRKPRIYFDTTPRPAHVLFDDAKQLRRALPWAHFVEARWDYAEPETIKVTIGEWLVIIVGRSLDPLLVAIVDHSLARVCAHPEFEGNTDHEMDSFATEIRFLTAPEPRKRKGQIELDLGLE